MSLSVGAKIRIVGRGAGQKALIEKLKTMKMEFGVAAERNTRANVFDRHSLSTNEALLEVVEEVRPFLEPGLSEFARTDLPRMVTYYVQRYGRSGAQAAESALQEIGEFALDRIRDEARRTRGIAESTLLRREYKVRAGYPGKGTDEPLDETGELLDSLAYRIIR